MEEEGEGGGGGCEGGGEVNLMGFLKYSCEVILRLGGLGEHVVVDCFLGGNGVRGWDEGLEMSIVGG